MSIASGTMALLTSVGLRVKPEFVPIGTTYPVVVFQQVSNTEDVSHNGISAEMPRIQLTCWGKDPEGYSQAVSTARTVKNAMDLNQTYFKIAFKENEFDAGEEEPGFYRVILEYLVWEK